LCSEYKSIMVMQWRMSFFRALDRVGLLPKKK
jgi:hypothetical protein